MTRIRVVIAVFMTLILPIASHAGTFTNGNPTTTNNDDTCEIAQFPAATLLLPYLDIDVTSQQYLARTTLFTVVNTTRIPQIARVTLWTDLGYPVLNFNLFLTGYDVQAINLRDVLVRGIVAPPDGTSSKTDPGPRSLDNDQNPMFAATAGADCVQTPGPMPGSIVQDVLSALTLGTISACGTSAIVGQAHEHAIGYATIDVVKTCGVTLPDSTDYYADLLYDNVLTGDYETVNPNPLTGNYAGGNPLVHIRAIPEGGPPGTIVPTNLPFTFYDRYTPRTSPFVDRRQPLPATFSARYIDGGTGGFSTELQIWREGVTGSGATCAQYARNTSRDMKVTDVVRFDEHENPAIYTTCTIILCPQPTITLPVTSSNPSSSAVFPPPLTSGDLGGWFYLNLNNDGSTAYSKPRHSQNWVTTTLWAEGRYSVTYDATMLANGCTAAPPVGAVIEPGPNSNP